MHYTPVQLVLRRLGVNVTVLATALGVVRDTIYLWQRRGGKIPEQYHEKILQLAKIRHKVLIKVLSKNVLTKQELFMGGEDE